MSSYVTLTRARHHGLACSYRSTSCHTCFLIECVVPRLTHILLQMCTFVVFLLLNQVVTQTVDLVELKTVDMGELSGFEAEPPTDGDPQTEVVLHVKKTHHDSELKSKAKTN